MSIEFTVRTVGLVLLALASTAAVSYALLRIEPDDSERMMFVTSLVLLVVAVVFTYEDVAALVTDDLSSGAMFPAVTGAAWVLAMVLFVVYTSHQWVTS